MFRVPADGEVTVCRRQQLALFVYILREIGPIVLSFFFLSFTLPVVLTRAAIHAIVQSVIGDYYYSSTFSYAAATAAAQRKYLDNQFLFICPIVDLLKALMVSVRCCKPQVFYDLTKAMLLQRDRISLKFCSAQAGLYTPHEP